MSGKILVVLVLVFSTNAAFADQGVWVADESFTNFNFVCQRRYVCSIPTPVIHADDEKIVSTPSKIQTGVCTVGSNSPTCGDCATNPPAEACDWDVVKK
ncbi:MAG: hypothetical protein EOS21_32420 [Mesorhizobium sp.]|nr:MAG: hypothetical protein EOS21_32420 [Mesorhizobium sp.]